MKVIGRPIDKGSVNTTQGQRWSVLEVGENLGQERIIESHTVGPEVQGIQNPVEALFPVQRIGTVPGVRRRSAAAIFRRLLGFILDLYLSGRSQKDRRVTAKALGTRRKVSSFI